MREADRKAFVVAAVCLPIALAAAILGKSGWFIGAIGCWGVGTGIVVVTDLKELRREEQWNYHIKYLRSKTW